MASSLRITAERAGLDDGQDILELGCGRGRDTRLLCALGSVTAVDIDAKALAMCADTTDAHTLQLDIAEPLPFNNHSFDVILASLSLHYFPWAVTQRIVAEMHRCLAADGRALVRLNSTEDTNYGAAAVEQIEQNYYHVASQTKRFFDEAAVEALFEHWRIVRLRHLSINRYAKTKAVWEVRLATVSR